MDIKVGDIIQKCINNYINEDSYNIISDAIIKKFFNNNKEEYEKIFLCTDVNNSLSMIKKFDNYLHSTDFTNSEDFKQSKDQEELTKFINTSSCLNYFCDVCRNYLDERKKTNTKN